MNEAEVLAMLALRESLRQTQEALRWALRQDGHMTWCQHQVLGHPCEPDCPYARALELQKEELAMKRPEATDNIQYHLSDCGVHNAPALPIGPCTCLRADFSYCTAWGPDYRCHRCGQLSTGLVACPALQQEDKEG